MFLGHEAEVTSSNLPFSITLGPKLTYIKKKRKKKEIFAGHALGQGSIDTSFGGVIPVSDTGHIYDTFACVS